MNACSDGKPRYCAVAPVAMISASQVYVPESPSSRNGRCEKSTLPMWS
jgi:hypothetical protein